MNSVFISYAHEDSKIAADIASVLADLNISHFLDKKEINWGNSITSKVQEGIENCIAIIIIVSPASQKSQWVPFEIGLASGSQRIILPFLTHASIDVPYYIRDRQYITTIDQAKNYFINRFPKEAESVPRQALTSSSRRVSLSGMQVDYLLEISKPRNQGAISSYLDEQTGRDVAPYQEAIQKFLAEELMQYGNGNYKLTPRGWKLVDQLWALKILEALHFGSYISEKEISEKVGLTDGQIELDELRRHLDGLERCELVSISRSRDSWCVEILEKGITYRKHQPIEV